MAIHHTDEELQQLFKDFDADGSGTVSVDELDSVARQVGVDIPREELLRLVQQVDEDNSGELGLNEFIKLIHSAEDQFTAITARLKAKYLDEKALAAGAADVIWYNEENILHREALKKNEGIQGAISNVWEAVRQACGIDDERPFNLIHYTIMSRKLYLAMKVRLFSTASPHLSPSYCCATQAAPRDWRTASLNGNRQRERLHACAPAQYWTHERLECPCGWQVGR